MREGNEPAIQTYKKLEFERFGVEEKALKINGVYYNEIHMVKFLEDKQ